MIKVVTIGVYGFTPETFFQALQNAQVDTFCDIRKRRGVRGSAYAFANSQRLQSKLAELGIRYVYSAELAPTIAVRQIQHNADQSTKTAKRQRTNLDVTFMAAYQQQILSQFNPQTWLSTLPGDAKVVALFCVEREPVACHRSLVAEKIGQTLGGAIVHLLP